MFLGETLLILMKSHFFQQKCVASYTGLYNQTQLTDDVKIAPLLIIVYWFVILRAQTY